MPCNARDLCIRRLRYALSPGLRRPSSSCMFARRLPEPSALLRETARAFPQLQRLPDIHQAQFRLFSLRQAALSLFRNPSLPSPSAPLRVEAEVSEHRFPQALSEEAE